MLVWYLYGIEQLLVWYRLGVSTYSEYVISMELVHRSSNITHNKSEKIAIVEFVVAAATAAQPQGKIKLTQYDTNKYFSTVYVTSKV